MKYLRFGVALAIFALILAAGKLAILHAADAGERGFSAGSYLVTTNDSLGNFASRTVITLHADQTMSVVDSGQGGPAFFFSSQLGSWKPDGSRRIVARTIDFNYPPGPGVARLDYNITLGRDQDQVTGTVTLRTYSLEESDPLNSDGTVVGTFTFAGELIKP